MTKVCIGTARFLRLTQSHKKQSVYEVIITLQNLMYISNLHIPYIQAKELIWSNISKTFQ